MRSLPSRLENGRLCLRNQEEAHFAYGGQACEDVALWQREALPCRYLSPPHHDPPHVLGRCLLLQCTRTGLTLQIAAES